MARSCEQLFRAIAAQAESYGIRVGEDDLPAETAGEFDGLSVTMNRTYDAEECCFYLVHAVGSIVRWSLDPRACQAVFDELQAARRGGKRDPGRLAKAIERYRAFEEAASEYAVWLLADLGHADAVPAYTTFARADIEMMAHFHREGKAPVWRDFFAAWKREVAAGKRRLRPYQPRPVPPFRPVPMRTQEVLQEVDGD